MSGFDSALRDESNAETSWIVKEPDESKYNFSDEKGVWQPKPEDILSMFEKLAHGSPLPIKWTCPGRRPPDRNLRSEKNTDDGLDMEDDDSKEEELKAPEISAFDFDEPHVDGKSKLIIKRTPGGLGRTPKTEKRVARMDNIMKSLQKQQLQRAAAREARKAKGTLSTTPNRSRLLNFGSSDSKNVNTGSSMPSGSHSPAASSPRFAGSSSTPNSGPLLNRGSMFMSPTLSSRKMTPKSGSNGQPAQVSTSDTRVSEASGQHMNTFTNSNQGSSFDFTENRLEHVSSVKNVTESSTDSLPSVTFQSKNIYTSSLSPAFNNPVTNNSTKVSTTSFISSTISSSYSSGNIISSSSAMSMEKEPLTTTISNQPLVSISSRVTLPTSSPTPLSGLTSNAAVPSETHLMSAGGVPSTQAGSHAGSGINVENAALEASINDQPSNPTESASLSTSSTIKPDAQNGTNIASKPQPSS